MLQSQVTMVEIALWEAINDATSLIYSAFKSTPSLGEYFPNTSAPAYDALKQAKNLARDAGLDAKTLFRSDHSGESCFAHHASSCQPAPYANAGSDSLGAIVWADMSDGDADPQPRSAETYLFKFVCYCTGEVLERYRTNADIVKKSLSSIRECLHNGGGVCYCLPPGAANAAVILPEDYTGCISAELQKENGLQALHALTWYKSKRHSEKAWKEYGKIKKALKILVGLDRPLRVLLDRNAMRALLKRPNGSKYSELNKTAHPKQDLTTRPAFATMILWLAQLPSPDPAFNPDAKFRRISRDDQGLFAVYACPLRTDLLAVHTLEYVEVSIFFADFAIALY